MAKIVVLGAGIAGHTAASHLRRKLGRAHEVLVVSPNSNYQWIPSNIWVGINRMDPKKIIFPLAPLYKKKGIGYKQAKVTDFWPEGSASHAKGFVRVEHIAGAEKGKIEEVEYDYLINATGPRLAFDQTPGLVPGEQEVYSVCTYPHAQEAGHGLKALIEKARTTDRTLRVLIGTGHPKATCQGAAFEYILNVEQELRETGMRDRFEITWISNEYELGDFGMDGMLLTYGKEQMHSKDMVEMVFADRGIKWITQAGVQKIDNHTCHYETLEGAHKTEPFDFAMLIPAFTGHGFKAYDREGGEITEKLFRGFMIVDADYTAKPYEQWTVQDWPETYQNPTYPNIYAPGIAFAPPHTISRPRKSPNGTEIFPSPPRTGMPSGITAKLVAENIVERVNGKQPHHKGSMGNMGAACIASSGFGFTKGSAITITTFPIVPDYQKYADTGGRDLRKTFGEMGLAGHWIKYALQVAFLWKAKMRPFWWLIPE